LFLSPLHCATSIAVEAELASAALDNVAESVVVIDFPDDRN
jgi:hypothetical protein